MKGKVILGAVVLAGAAVFATAIGASLNDISDLTAVPSANPKAAGYAPASQLSTELRQTLVAQGSQPLENPQGIVGWYGYENDAPSPDNPALAQFVPALGSTTEAQKTEPDKNTYLVLRNQHGAGSALRLRHPLPLPGARGRRGDPRLEPPPELHHADQPRRRHRPPRHADGDTGRPGQPDRQGIDGSTWDPCAQRLLFTTENRPLRRTRRRSSVPVDRSRTSRARSGAAATRASRTTPTATSGSSRTSAARRRTGSTAKRPNSFIYRYVPSRPGDLHNGKLQVLQVLNAARAPITFESQAALNAPDQVALHTYGNVFNTKWVTIHDTARRRHRAVQREHAREGRRTATPFKRPENGQFRPGSKLRRVLLRRDRRHERDRARRTATRHRRRRRGRLDGSIFKLTQSQPLSSTGKLRSSTRATSRWRASTT